MPSSTRWRIYITAFQPGGSEPGIAELTMASAAGGSNLCTGGTPSASSEFSGTYSAAKAFDGNAATYWDASGGGTAWLEYQFGSAVSIVQYGIKAVPSPFELDTPKDFKLQYFDGSTWVDQDTQTNQISWYGGEVRTFPIASKMQWRFMISLTQNMPTDYYRMLGEVELRTAASGADQATDGSRAWAFTSSGAYLPDKAVDGTNTTSWSSGNTGIPNEEWRYWFDVPKDVVEYVIVAPNESDYQKYAPKTWTLEYWDGSTWIVADTRTAEPNWSSGESRTYSVPVVGGGAAQPVMFIVT
jgi:hypothetical protein